MSWPTKKAVRAGVRALQAQQPDTPDEQAALAVLEAAGLPKLVGHRGAAEILEVSHPNLSKVAGLPEPLYVLAAGRFYAEDEIRALKAKRDKARAKRETTA